MPLGAGTTGGPVRMDQSTWVAGSERGYNDERSTDPSPTTESFMEITLTVPDELATRLRPVQTDLPTILELGMREWNARGGTGFAGLATVLETLASLPSPEEVLALRPSASLQERIDYLLEKSQSTSISDEERREWEQYEYTEHLVRLAKARAALKLRGA